MKSTSLFIASMLCCLSLSGFAEEAKKPEAPKTLMFPRGPEVETVKKELGLTDAEIEKARAAVDAVVQKNEEFKKIPAVAEAEAEFKRADEAKKAAEDAKHAVEDKLKALKSGFDFKNECKKAVCNTLPDEKKQKAAVFLKLKPDDAAADAKK